MARHLPYCMVPTYEEDLQQMIAYTVEPDTLAPLLADRMGVVLTDEHDFKLNEAFAREPGVGMLNTIALGQTSIKQYIGVTQALPDASSKA